MVESSLRKSKRTESQIQELQMQTFKISHKSAGARVEGIDDHFTIDRPSDFNSSISKTWCRRGSLREISKRQVHEYFGVIIYISTDFIPSKTHHPE